MHTRTQLLSACVTVLIVATSALPTSTETDSKIIYSGYEPTGGLKLPYDNVDTNTFFLNECQFSENRSQINCYISRLPLDETNLQTCNLKIDASDIGSVDLKKLSVYRFKDNKLMVHVAEEFPDLKRLSSFHIFKNCVAVKTLSSVNRKNGTIVELQKLVIYEDGFDIAMPESHDENALIQYQSFDSDGKQIGKYAVLSGQLPRGTYRWPAVVDPVHYAKKHSRGVAFSTGYHFYPNGTIVRFADDQYKKLMEVRTVVNHIDDGSFFTACADVYNHSIKSSELNCRQYDVDHPRLIAQGRFASPLDLYTISPKNLEKGGFLIALGNETTLTVHVIRPDRPASVDNISFGSHGFVLLVPDFNEATGKITFIRGTDFDLNSVTLVKSQYLLQNYAKSLTENV